MQDSESDNQSLNDKICDLRSKIIKYRGKKNLTAHQEEILHELESSLAQLYMQYHNK
jgi:hypothetical protein